MTSDKAPPSLGLGAHTFAGLFLCIVVGLVGPPFLRAISGFAPPTISPGSSIESLEDKAPVSVEGVAFSVKPRGFLEYHGPSESDNPLSRKIRVESITEFDVVMLATGPEAVAALRSLAGLHARLTSAARETRHGRVPGDTAALFQEFNASAGLLAGPQAAVVTVREVATRGRESGDPEVHSDEFSLGFDPESLTNSPFTLKRCERAKHESFAESAEARLKSVYASGEPDSTVPLDTWPDAGPLDCVNKQVRDTYVSHQLEQARRRAESLLAGYDGSRQRLEGLVKDLPGFAALPDGGDRVLLIRNPVDWSIILLWLGLAFAAVATTATAAKRHLLVRRERRALMDEALS